jgi:hypothetical protein
MDGRLVEEFGEEMFRIYQRARSEAGDNASRFLQMLHDYDGLETARILIHSATPSEGYTALCRRRHLELTIEAVIHDNPRWHALFTEGELATCRQRLEQYGYLKPAISM